MMRFFKLFKLRRLRKRGNASQAIQLYNDIINQL